MPTGKASGMLMESLGKYRIVRPMKVGGSGDLSGGDAWGKSLSPRSGDQTTFCHLVADRVRAMFVDEAHIVSRLAHSNVCQVLDLVARHDELYIVLEYLKRCGRPRSCDAALRRIG